MHISKRGFRPGFFAFGAHKELVSGDFLKVTNNKVRVGNKAASGITTGLVAAKVIATTELEALLDTNENNLFAVNEGDVILEMVLYVGTACGESASLDIGLDAAALGTTKDPNGFITAGNLNAVGVYLAADTVTDATAPTYQGDLFDDGPVTVDADGYVLIDSSANESSSAFVGQIVMYYIPA